MTFTTGTAQNLDYISNIFGSQRHIYRNIKFIILKKIICKTKNLII